MIHVYDLESKLNVVQLGISWNSIFIPPFICLLLCHFERRWRDEKIIRKEARDRAPFHLLNLISSNQILISSHGQQQQGEGPLVNYTLCAQYITRGQKRNERPKEKLVNRGPHPEGIQLFLGN